jgi:hydroxyacylglutathione hydrolase
MKLNNLFTYINISNKKYIIYNFMQLSFVKNFKLLRTSVNLNKFKSNIIRFNFYQLSQQNKKCVAFQKFSSSNFCGICSSQKPKCNGEKPNAEFDFNTIDYYVEQINTGCLAQFAYYIESNGEAAIIDPLRESEPYLEILKKRGAKLKYIFETHFHADFVSGHLELSKITGASIVFGPNAKPNHDATVAKDDQLFPLGTINIKAFHTPGHTLESTSYILLNSNYKAKAIFTGDFLFLGEVGRPDLAVGKSVSKEYLAGLIYESLQRLKKEYTDDLIIFPGHGAGSACGKKISKGSMDSLKNQKKTHYALSDKLTKEDFIHIASSDLPTPPEYFFHDAKMNIQGAEEIKPKMESAMKELNIQDIEKILKDSNIKIVDTREFSISKKNFIKGSYLVPLSLPYAVWVATLLKPTEKIILLTDPGKEKESVIRLFRVGYDNIVGVIKGSEENFAKLSNINIASINTIKSTDVKSLIEKNENDRKFSLLDVRDAAEWKETGILKDSHKLSLKDLEKEIEKIKGLNSKGPIGIYCKSGARASIAAAILKKYDVNCFVLGGYDKMKELNIPFCK